MAHPVHLALLLHNHQPVGNFDHVFEQAYRDSYLPFLEVFEPYDGLRIALHTSGPLIEWLDQRHPEYLDRLGQLVRDGRIEIIGGAFYEPILAMLPSHDRVGQIRSFTHWLEDRLDGSVRGMWIPERVWEQSMTRDLATAGIEYTLLDDYHFKNGGLCEDQLHGYYITEDDGHILRVFPGSERLRYLIPFAEPEETVAELGRISDRHPGAVVTFGDDGEKFGTWPETHRHVYTDGWLRRFFDLLVANKDWLQTITPAAALDSIEPVGKIYLPEGSYREMTEWALPAERQLEFEQVHHELEAAGQWQRVAQFIQGGFWRNFKVRYPESDEMYARSMQVSRRLQAALETGSRDPHARELLERARRHLYRGQCNCSYWHGAFGGIYLPHLRNAVFHQLIAADRLLDQAEGREEVFLDVVQSDINFDGHDEVVITSDRLAAYFEPAAGGQLYELDVRSICHNLLATLARRPEAYHQKVLAGPSDPQGDVASIHDRVVFKQEGLEKLVQYDPFRRKSLQDHFFDNDVTLAGVASGQVEERGDFVQGRYAARVRDHEDSAVLSLSRQGNAAGVPVTVTKQVAISAGSSTLDISYLLAGLPSDRPLHFAVELNFAGLPAGADDRYFYDSQHQNLGQLGSQLDLHAVDGLGLIDQWLGADVGLTANRPTNIWTFPIASVSQSEGGYEAVHQSVVVMPHWQVQGDADGRWSVAMRLSIDTSLAESRAEESQMASVGSM